jgi:monofunctional biosynthetic peptidoglycan transglycosylase
MSILMLNPRTFLKRGIRWAIPGALLAGGIAWLILPWPVIYRWKDPEVTSFMRYRERQAEVDGVSFELRHAWIDWVALGEELGYAGEPPFSWFDPGDLKALWGAVRYGWTHRAEVRGRSTITQQLAKNLYFTPDRSLGRKAAETVVAWRLEWFLSKDRILELYLNSVELGSGIFGVEAAAQAYFGTSVTRLGAWEAASLAATLPHPLTSNPAYRPGRMAWRRDLIFGRLTGSSGAAPGVSPAPPDLEPPPLPVDP